MFSKIVNESENIFFENMRKNATWESFYDNFILVL